MYQFLPNEIYLNIFRMLNLKDLLNLDRVNKEVHQCIANFYLNFNYSNKMLFTKWLSKELTSAKSAIKNYQRDYLEKRLLNPDNAEDREERDDNYLSLLVTVSLPILILFILFLLYNYCQQIPRQSDREKHLRFIKEHNDITFYGNYLLNNKNSITDVQYITKQMYRNLQYKIGPYEHPNNSLDFKLIFIYVILLIIFSWLLYFFIKSFLNARRHFLQRNIHGCAFENLKNLVKNYQFFFDNFVNDNDIQTQHTTNCVLSVKLAEFSTKFTNEIEQIFNFIHDLDLSGLTISERHLNKLPEKNRPIAQKLFTLFNQKHPGKEFYLSIANEENKKSL